MTGPRPSRARATARLSDREMAAWQALLHAHDVLIRQLGAELRERHGISLSDYDVLVRLARVAEHRMPMSELAQRAMFSPSGLTRVVDRLVDRGLVERTRDGADSRVIHASLTAAGSTRVRQASRTHLDGIRRRFTSQLSDEQLDQVAGALEMISGPHVPH
ncbi:MAG: MarR family transcriptional regulator [Candidatus Limnocylindria bacterium]